VLSSWSYGWIVWHNMNFLLTHGYANFFDFKRKTWVLTIDIPWKLGQLWSTLLLLFLWKYKNLWICMIFYMDGRENILVPWTLHSYYFKCGKKHSIFFKKRWVLIWFSAQNPKSQNTALATNALKCWILCERILKYNETFLGYIHESLVFLITRISCIFHQE
jgi:hypothetical protein